MKELKTLLFVVLAAAFFIGLFIVSDRFADEVHTQYASFITAPVPEGASASNTGPVSPDDVLIEKWIEKAVEDSYSTEIDITAAGDILIQDQQLSYALDAETGAFDFSESFKYVKQMLSDSSFTVATLKTTMAGKDQGYYNEFYGYNGSMSLYNSPESLADTLRDTGITLVNTATNHALDSDAQGIFSTLDYLDAAGVKHIGTSREDTESKDYILETDGLRIAFTGWTNLTNEMILSEQYAYALNKLDDYASEEMKKLCDHVAELKEENDFVIVMLNFGSASSSSIETDQRTAAEKIVRAGADLILGTGSLAVKPMEVLSFTGDDGYRHDSTVFYGLGDLISSESYYYHDGLDVDFGMILRLKIKRQINGSLALSSFAVYPTYINWSDYQIQTIPALNAASNSEYTSLLYEDALSRLAEGPENLMENLVGDTEYTYTLENDHYLVNLQ